MKPRRSVAAGAVRRELLPDQSVELLRELHLVTRDGRVNADALRKLKQVNHLVGLLRPALEDVLERFGDPVVVDGGSGNAYLGFVLYELFFTGTDKGRIVSIESRQELSDRASERARKLGFSRMQFATGPLDGAVWPERVHLAVALHACDTATDDVLAAAVKANADHIAVVPCCQAEVARQLEQSGEAALSVLWEHPMHRREFGSHLTNVMRTLALESLGYRVTVTELVGWEHSLKNELLLAKKVRSENREARERLRWVAAQTGARPRLVRTLSLLEA